MKDTNPIVYKFRDWNNQYHRLIISKQELFFSGFDSFNDPFDINLPFKDKFDFSLKDMLLLLSGQYKFSKVEISKVKEKFQDIDLTSSFGEYMKAKNEKFKEMEDNLGILCLASYCDNPLMWGHYGNSQKGFCIGFNREKLIEELGSKIDKRKINYSPVKYNKLIPQNKIILAGKDQIMEEATKYLTNRLFTKSKDWSYEKEFRIVVINFVNKVFKIEGSIINEVIFGYKMNKASKIEIRAICEKLLPHVNFFQARPSTEKYVMEINPV